MNNIVVSMLGNRLDNVGFGKKRWLRWRPTLSLLMHHELPIDELVLIYQSDDHRLADLTLRDAEMTCPNLKTRRYQVSYGDAWDFEQVYAQLHDFALNHPFDPENNQYFFHITTGTHVAQICLYLLTEANYFPGKLIQSSPSKAGPHGQYQIIDLDLSRYDQIASRFQREAQQAISYLKSGIETRNHRYNRMIDEIEQVAIRSSSPILLTGPTGVGKSHLAQKIFELKQQRGQVRGRFVEINCATLRGDNAMSALFGHVKGAFTGALKTRKGLLLEADQGLLFLDEIGELGLDEQAMLLRAIEDKVFMPFGSDQSVSSDFQLIAGSNRDLRQQVQNGGFREDLLARINLWHYQLPALKDRPEDIEPNLDYELRQFASRMNQKVSFNRNAKARYLAFALSAHARWSANFRDLNASVTRMATLAANGRISEEIVDNELERLQRDWKTTVTNPGDDDHDFLQQILPAEVMEKLDCFEVNQLAQVLRVCQQSKSLADAGRKLFNKSRLLKSASNDSQRLRLYLKKYRLDFKKISESLNQSP